MKTLTHIGAAIAGVVVTLLLSASGVSFGGVYSQVQKYFSDGISVGTTNQLTVSNAGVLTTSGAITTTADATVSGGTLIVTTSNTATSSIVGGCFEFYATSTASPHKFQASTTPGVMVSQFGSCPRL